MSFKLISVNVGKVAPLRVGTRTLLSGIGKKTVGSAVLAVSRLGLEGDEQADLSIHGGLQKALYAYPIEHYPLWQQHRQSSLNSLFDETMPAGFMGENLTIDGLLEHQVWVGDRLEFANCSLRVTAPREPCGKFNAIMGNDRSGKFMADTGSCGFYLTVDKIGSITAGETFHLVAGSRGMSIAQAFANQWRKHSS